MRRIVFIVTGLLQAALGLWLETTTVPKVVVMAQIKGWLPGARPAVVRVADKWHSSYGGRDAYWISWGEGDVRIPGNHRIDLREREWRGTQIGDQLEVIYAGTGPFNVYRRGGVFTEPGNFVFDGVLLLNLKGPRFRFLCEEHLKLPKKKQDEVLASWAEKNG